MNVCWSWCGSRNRALSWIGSQCMCGRSWSICCLCSLFIPSGTHYFQLGCINCTERGRISCHNEECIMLPHLSIMFNHLMILIMKWSVSYDGVVLSLIMVQVGLLSIMCLLHMVILSASSFSDYPLDGQQFNRNQPGPPKRTNSTYMVLNPKGTYWIFSLFFPLEF